MTEIPNLPQEWRTPRHPELPQDGKNVWRLFNAATETAKGDIWPLPQRTAIIHDVFDADCGIQKIASPAATPTNVVLLSA